MRVFILAVLFVFGAASAALAASHTGDLTKLTCKQMKAAADAGQLSDADAGNFYAWGMWMGDHCMRPDYVKAFRLLGKAGQFAAMQSILDVVVSRAHSGSPSAQSALRKLKAARLITIKNGPDSFAKVVRH